MFVVIACICFAFLSGHVSGQSGYTLEFPQQGVTDYANIWGMRSLTQFTVCFWMKTRSTASGTPFSYATSDDENNELLIDNPTNLHLTILQLAGQPMGISASDGKWHHICVTWRNSDGEWKSYKDGVLAHTGRGYGKGSTIKAGGSLVLGQEQDSLGGAFDSSQSFTGMLANVNVWSFVLPESKIKDMSKCCWAGKGDVYMWADFINAIRGKPRYVNPSRCPCAL